VLLIALHNKREIEEDLLAFRSRHPMLDPILVGISFIPLEPCTFGQLVESHLFPAFWITLLVIMYITFIYISQARTGCGDLQEPHRSRHRDRQSAAAAFLLLDSPQFIGHLEKRPG